MCSLFKSELSVFILKPVVYWDDLQRHSLRESSYILTFSIKFTHSELHSGGFPDSLGGCTTSYVSEMPKRSNKNLSMYVLLTRRIRATWYQTEGQ